jgi:hypothetical protein
MKISLAILAFSGILGFGTGKEEAPEFVKPVCENFPCKMRFIKAKSYIEDSLWLKMGEDPETKIKGQLNVLSDAVNKHLENLDNGGYNIDLAANVVKLSESKIFLKDTYVDRLDGNVTKQADPEKIHSHTFTFQEAVQLLPDRSSVDVRVLFIRERGPSPYATAEETCMCNLAWFGCIVVFSIRDRNIWADNSAIMAHEVGHTLGMDIHDDDIYKDNPGNRLLMWSGIGRSADIWSPEAKRRINKQDNSCLKTMEIRTISSTTRRTTATLSGGRWVWPN